MKKKILVLVPLLLLTGGCAQYGTVSRELAKNGAIVKMKIGTPWGVQDIIRVGTTTNKVEIRPDGTIIINQ